MHTFQYVLMSIILLVWGSFAAVSKLVLRNIDNFQLMFYIFGFAFLAMTIIFIISGKIKELFTLSREDFIKLFLFSLPSFLYYFLYILSLRLIPAVEASMLNYLFPVLIVVISAPVNGEKINKSIIASIIVGLVGMIIIVSNGNLGVVRLSNWLGDLLAIGGAVCWALFSNIGKKNKIDTLLSNYCFTFFSFILSCVVMLIFSKPVIPDVPATVGLLWLGLSNILLAFYLWFKVLKVTSSALVASFSFITPFITLLFIMLFLRENISFMQLLGLLVILTGVGIQKILSVIETHKNKIESLENLE